GAFNGVGCHGLDPAGVLDLQLARHQMRADLQVCCGVLLPHLFNRGRPVLFEVGSECEQEVLVERSTCSLQRTATHGLVAGDIKGLAEPALALTVPDEPTEADDGLLTAREVP